METEISRERRWDIVQFKSYYVVWKPRFVAKNPRIIGSLNRTMQYGNSSGSDHPVRHDQFKSYYVVWKLKNIAQANKSWAV